MFILHYIKEYVGICAVLVSYMSSGFIIAGSAQDIAYVSYSFSITQKKYFVDT